MSVAQLRSNKRCMSTKVDDAQVSAPGSSLLPILGTSLAGASRLSTTVAGVWFAAAPPSPVVHLVLSGSPLGDAHIKLELHTWAGQWQPAWLQVL